jgi:hypothetical protein
MLKTVPTVGASMQGTFSDPENLTVNIPLFQYRGYFLQCTIGATFLVWACVDHQNMHPELLFPWSYNNNRKPIKLPAKHISNLA